ncbi:MAG: hypothetical protein Fur0032_12960 [Terrimicrobiaceae bacterium]
MDNDQAKLILAAYCPGGKEASHPSFEEALDQARRDPGLGECLAGQQQFDEFCQKAFLRDRLLVIGRAFEKAGLGRGGDRRVWSLIFRLAMATCLLVLAGLGFLIFTSMPTVLKTDTLVHEDTLRRLI